MLPTVRTSGGYKICLSSQNQLLVQTDIVVPWLSRAHAATGHGDTQARSLLGSENKPAALHPSTQQA